MALSSQFLLILFKSLPKILFFIVNQTGTAFVCFKRDMCIQPFAELPDLRAFVRAISPFPFVWLAFRSFDCRVCSFVHALTCSFVHSLLLFVRFVASHLVTWLVRSSIAFSLELPFM